MELSRPIGTKQVHLPRLPPPAPLVDPPRRDSAVVRIAVDVLFVILVLVGEVAEVRHHTVRDGVVVHARVDHAARQLAAELVELGVGPVQGVVVQVAFAFEVEASREGPVVLDELVWVGGMAAVGGERGRGGFGGSEGVEVGDRGYEDCFTHLGPVVDCDGVDTGRCVLGDFPAGLEGEMVS